MELSRRRDLLQLEPQGVVKIEQPEPVKDQEPDKIPGEEEGQVKPDLLSVQILVEPGEEVLPAQKEEVE